MKESTHSLSLSISPSQRTQAYSLPTYPHESNCEQSPIQPSFLSSVNYPSDIYSKSKEERMLMRMVDDYKKTNKNLLQSLEKERQQVLDQLVKLQSQEQEIKHLTAQIKTFSNISLAKNNQTQQINQNIPPGAHINERCRDDVTAKREIDALKETITVLRRDQLDSSQKYYYLVSSKEKEVISLQVQLESNNQELKDLKVIIQQKEDRYQEIKLEVDQLNVLVEELSFNLKEQKEFSNRIQVILLQHQEDLKNKILSYEDLNLQCQKQKIIIDRSQLEMESNKLNHITLIDQLQNQICQLTASLEDIQSQNSTQSNMIIQSSPEESLLIQNVKIKQSNLKQNQPEQIIKNYQFFKENQPPINQTNHKQLDKQSLNSVLTLRELNSNQNLRSEEILNFLNNSEENGYNQNSSQSNKENQLEMYTQQFPQKEKEYLRTSMRKRIKIFERTNGSQSFDRKKSSHSSLFESNENRNHSIDYSQANLNIGNQRVSTKLSLDLQKQRQSLPFDPYSSHINKYAMPERSRPIKLNNLGISFDGKNHGNENRVIEEIRCITLLESATNLSGEITKILDHKSSISKLKDTPIIIEFDHQIFENFKNINEKQLINFKRSLLLNNLNILETDDGLSIGFEMSVSKNENITSTQKADMLSMIINYKNHSQKTICDLSLNIGAQSSPCYYIQLSPSTQNKKIEAHEQATDNMNIFLIDQFTHPIISQLTYSINRSWQKKKVDIMIPVNIIRFLERKSSNYESILEKHDKNIQNGWHLSSKQFNMDNNIFQRILDLKEYFQNCILLSQSRNNHISAEEGYLEILGGEFVLKSNDMSFIAIFSGKSDNLIQINISGGNNSQINLAEFVLQNFIFILKGDKP